MKIIEYIKKLELVKTKFLEFAKRDWIYEITNDEIGRILEKHYEEEQNLQNGFEKLKQQYDLLYKNYEIHKSEKRSKWVIAIILAMIVLDLVTIFAFRK